MVPQWAGVFLFFNLFATASGLRMNWSVRSTFNTFLFVLAHCAISCFAATLKKELIHGYPVYILDTGRGNASHFSINFRSGYLHDDPSSAGLAHFLEHAVLLSSDGFADYTAIENSMTKIGGDFDAQTSQIVTEYKWNGHIQRLDAAIDHYAQVFDKPHFDDALLEKEKRIVIAEIGSIQEDPEWAMIDINFLIGLGHSHPLRHSALGSKHDIQRISRHDVETRFRKDLSPESVFFMLAGNFSGPKNSQKLGHALTNISEGFDLKTWQKISEDAAREGHYSSAHRVYPDFFTPAEVPAKTVVSSEEPSLLLTYQALGEVYFTVNNIISDYLTYDLENNLRSTLLSSGYIWDMSLGFERINNILSPVFELQLTNKGSSKLGQVTALVQAALSDLMTNGIKHNVLQELITRNTRFFAGKTATDLALFIVNSAAEGRHPVADVDFQKHFSSVTNEHIKNGAKALFGSGIKPMVLVASPDLPNRKPDAHTHGRQVWREPYPRASQTKLSKGLNVDFFNHVTVGNQLSLFQQPESENTIGAVEYSNGQGTFNMELAGVMKTTRVFFDLQPNSDRVYTAVLIKNPDKITIHEYQGQQVLVRAFENDIAQFINELSSNGVGLRLESKPEGIQFLITGPKGTSWSYAEEILRRFSKFRVDQRKISATLKELQSEYKLNGSKFPASDATVELVAVLNHPLSISEGSALNNRTRWSEDRLFDLRDRTVKESEIYGSIVGDLALDVIKNRSEDLLLTDSTITSPIPFHAIKSAVRSDSLLWLPSKWQDSGWARAYPGPVMSDYRESAAFEILDHILSRKIFAENRERRGLGYIQSSFVQKSRGRIALIFTGESRSSIKKLKAIDSGWEQVVRVFLTHRMSEDEFKSLVETLRLGLEVQNEDLETRALSLLEYASFGLSRLTFEETINAMAKLTLDDLYEVAEKYLKQGKHTDVVATTDKKVSEELSRRCRLQFSQLRRTGR